MEEEVNFKEHRFILLKQY